ncbi:MAG: hypothetical protein K2L97_04700, partial [Muribaculaceae bacterium]|nr:hypothetical protein [Muribaculaceae bacterium]
PPHPLLRSLVGSEMSIRDRPVLLEIYTIDGRMVRSLMIEGSGSTEVGVKGVVIINAGGTVTKSIL